MTVSRQENLWIDGSLRSIYHQLFSNPEQRGAEAIRLLLYGGEYSLAMEEIAACVLVNGQLFPPELLPTFRTLATKLDLLENGFVRAVLQGQREMPPEEELPPI